VLCGCLGSTAVAAPMPRPETDPTTRAEEREPEPEPEPGEPSPLPTEELEFDQLSIEHEKTLLAEIDKLRHDLQPIHYDDGKEPSEEQQINMRTRLRDLEVELQGATNVPRCDKCPVCLETVTVNDKGSCSAPCCGAVLHFTCLAEAFSHTYIDDGTGTSTFEECGQSCPNCRATAPGCFQIATAADEGPANGADAALYHQISDSHNFQISWYY
jgi:hypothetical protein